MYLLLGISITLAMLLIANIGIAALASLLWRVSSSLTSGWSAAVRAELVFALRAFPVVASLSLVLGYIVPSYLLHEPFDSGEVVSRKLALVAIVSTAAVFFAVYRVMSSWISTRRMIRTWMRGADVAAVEGGTVPVYRIEHEFPIIAVTGIFRPRMFIARRVLDSLEPGELAASIAHEYGHLTARDNFKRTILRFCRDLMILPVGSRLDHDWAESAESAADEFAAREGSKGALDLASALIKISRIVPTHGHAAMPVATFLLGSSSGDITSRVRALLRLSEHRPERTGRRLSPLGSISISCFAAVLLLPFFDNGLYLYTHHCIEAFVHLLQ